MKIQIVNPLPMQWDRGFQSMLPDAEKVSVPVAGADTYVFMWADLETAKFINSNPKQGKYVVFIRRYELFSGMAAQIDWTKVDEIICVNDHLAHIASGITHRDINVVYNGIVPEHWTFGIRQHGKNVAMVGYVCHKKNYPLAMQIMSKLKGYTLHIVGDIQEFDAMEYIDNMARAMKVKVIYHGHLPHKVMNRWLSDKNYILNTAVSEGCPNHVIEAMAKGIKPLVHNWPGAREQFGGYVFNTVDEAVEMVAGEYDSEKYRNLVVEKFGVANYERVIDIICN